MIRVGIGGWTFEPWRGGAFYPKGLPQARELEYAAQHLTAIEVNGTYYGSQKPESFRRWAAETPDDFVFSLKGPRFATNRRVLAEAGDSIKRFMASGVTELKGKLGPLLWQFAPTKKFDEADFGAFLDLLPDKAEGQRIRHVVEVRHESFVCSEFVNLARTANVAIVFADSEKFPAIPDVTADFVYARLQCAAETVATGYTAKALDQWAARAQAWAKGGAPDDLACVADKAAAGKGPAGKARDVFVYMINGAKVRAPAAAMGLIERLK